jgi:ABC-type spermidine/putrescine transport system permease subunit I
MLFNAWVVVIALVHVFIPFMVLPIANALRGINPSLYDASSALGASGWTNFRRITLPLSFPGIQAGVVLVFILAVSAYVTPALLGGQAVVLMPGVIVDQLTGAFAWPFGGALAITLAMACLIVVLGFSLMLRPLARRTSAS